LSSKQITLSGFVSKVQQISLKIANKDFTSLTVLDNIKNNPMFVIVDKERYDILVEHAGLIEDTQSERRKDPTQAQQQLLKIKHRFPFFEGISDEDIVAITENVRFVKMQKSETVFQQGEGEQDIYIVLKGSIGIYIRDIDNKRVTLATLEKGAVFGEMAYITDEPRTANAASLGNGTLVLGFRIIDQLDGMEKVFNSLYINFIDILAHNLKNTNHKLFNK